MNTEVMFSSKTDMWETPQDFFDKLNDEFGFDVDVCATAENAKCSRYFTKEQDGLLQEWDGAVWCNPPYGKEIGKWVRKAYETNLQKKIIMLSCYCLPEPTRHGFMITFMEKQKLDLFVGV